MVLVVTAALLVLCVLTLCWLGVSTVYVRRRLLREDGAFVCRARVETGSVPGLRTRSRGTACTAQWCHEVLLLRRGRLLPRVHALPVRSTRGGIAPAVPADRLRRDHAALLLVLRLDDGAAVSVVTETATREALAGPFLALAVSPSLTEMPRQRSD